VIVLDTNVVSELMRSEPASHVVDWIASQPATSLFTTSITQAEIYHGIHLLPVGGRRTAFQEAAEAMFAQDFRGRVLAFSPDAALPYARFAVARRQAGRPVSQFDAQIVAIAACHGARIATRNTVDFELCGLGVINPWQPQ
jgi:predicted nucleic acid-binding protein